MPLVQMFSPAGTVPAHVRDTAGPAVMAAVMRAEGAPDNDAARAISWLTWQELDHWWIGPEPVRAGAPPRYLVRVIVPAGAVRDDEHRSEFVQRVTDALDRYDEDPGRPGREGTAWVIVDEVPEGNWGVFGRVIRFEDIKAFVNAGA